MMCRWYANYISVYLVLPILRVCSSCYPSRSSHGNSVESRNMHERLGVMISLSISIRDLFQLLSNIGISLS